MKEPTYPYADQISTGDGEWHDCLVLGKDADGNLRIRITDPRAGEENGVILIVAITQ